MFRFKGFKPETGKRQNPLNKERVWKQENDKILSIQKDSGNRKMTKSFKYGRVWKQGNDIMYDVCVKKGNVFKKDHKILWLVKKRH